jgi:hypothetical protein
MKPYGREKKRLHFPGKVDYHPGKGYVNWWERECSNIIPRSTMKQKLNKEIKEESNG